MNKSEDTKVVTRDKGRARVAPLTRFSREGDEFEMRLNLPGVAESGLKVEIADRILTVEAERTAVERNGAQWLRREFPPVDYQAAYELPEDVDPASISAKLSNGVLTLRLRKRAELKPRQVKIKVA